MTSVNSHDALPKTPQSQQQCAQFSGDAPSVPLASSTPATVLVQSGSPSAPSAASARPVSAAVDASWRIVAEVFQRDGGQQLTWSPGDSPGKRQSQFLGSPSSAVATQLATLTTKQLDSAAILPLHLQPRLSPAPSPLLQPSQPRPRTTRPACCYRYTPYATNAPAGPQHAQNGIQDAGPDSAAAAKAGAQPLLPPSSVTRRCSAMGKRRPRRPLPRVPRPGGRLLAGARPLSGQLGTPDPDGADSDTPGGRKCTLCNVTAVGTIRGRKQHYCARCSNYRAAVHKFGLRTRDVRRTIEEYGIDLTNHEFVERALSLRPDLDPRASEAGESDATDAPDGAGGGVGGNQDCAGAMLPRQQRRNRGIPARASVEGYDGDEAVCQICSRPTNTETGRARRMCLPCSRVRARLGQEGMSLQVCWLQ